jgi:hypothetical protein
MADRRYGPGVAPLTFAGVGWILATLGVSGPLGVHIGILGVAVTLLGVYRIRWRNQALAWTLWASAALLVSLIALFVPIPRTFLHVLLISTLQAVVGVGLATGVREGLVGGGSDPSVPPVIHLPFVRILILVTFGGTLAAVIVDALVFAVPYGTLLLLGFLALVTNLWLAVILVKVRNEPSVQEHTSGEA